MTAVIPQAASRRPGERSSRAMSAETMNIPEPIMLPTMMVVASKSLRPRTSCSLGAVASKALASSCIGHPPGSMASRHYTPSRRRFAPTTPGRVRAPGGPSRRSWQRERPARKGVVACGRRTCSLDLRASRSGRLQLDQVPVRVAEEDLPARGVGPDAERDPEPAELLRHTFEVRDAEGDVSIVREGGIARQIRLHHDVQLSIADRKPGPGEVE